MDTFKNFIALAALVGLYFAAIDVDLVEWFWIVLAAAVSLAFGKRSVGWLREVMRRYRAFAALEDKVEKLENELLIAEAGRRGVTLDWISEGRFQILGYSLAANFSGLEIVDSLSKDDVVYLGGRWSSDPPLTGMRLNVVRSSDGRVLGVVQVVEVIEESGYARLLCVDHSEFEFWDKIRIRATSDYRPPGGVVLEPFTLDEEWGVIDASKYRIPKSTEVVDSDD